LTLRLRLPYQAEFACRAAAVPPKQQGEETHGYVFIHHEKTGTRLAYSFRVAGCAYQASTRIAPERCPMCGGRAWHFESDRTIGPPSVRP
jgi:hypothetical protein